MLENPVGPWVGKIRWRRDRLPTPVFSGSPCGSAGEESPCNVVTWVRSLGSEDPLAKGKSYPLQFSGLENSMDCIFAKSQTGLSDFHFSFPT